MLSLSSAREHAVSSVQEAQKRYKKQYDKKARTDPLRCGDWALVRFPQDKSGKQRKLTRRIGDSMCPMPEGAELACSSPLTLMARVNHTLTYIHLDTAGLFKDETAWLLLP